MASCNVHIERSMFVKKHRLKPPSSELSDRIMSRGGGGGVLFVMQVRRKP